MAHYLINYKVTEILHSICRIHNAPCDDRNDASQNSTTPHNAMWSEDLLQDTFDVNVIEPLQLLAL